MSKKLKIVLIVIGSIILLLGSFEIGFIVGYKKADFKNNWSQNYGRFFGEPKGGFFMMQQPFDGNMMMNPHGNSGSIIKIDGNTLYIKDNFNNEKTILVNGNTVIRKFNNEIKISDLKVGDLVVVLGVPNNNGQVEAKLIRVFPAPQQ